MIMNPELFANLGIAGVALYIIYTMLQYFMSTLSKKDTQITSIIDNQSRVVERFKKHVEICNNNFIDLNKQSNIISVQQTEVLKQLVLKIDKLTISK